MKINKRLGLLTFISVILSSCSAGGMPFGYDDSPLDLPWEDYEIPVQEVIFSNDDLNKIIDKNDTYTYNYEVFPKNASKENLIWRSLDTNIVSVDNATITGVNPGSTTIGVYYKENLLKNLNVTVDVKLEDFDVSPSGLITLDYYESATFTATFTPSDTVNKELVYEEVSENDPLLEVNGNKITAKNVEGDTKIKITHPLSNKVKFVDVKVKTTHVDGITLNTSNFDLEVGKTFKLEASVTPVDATNKNLIYDSSDPTVADISSEGNIIAYKEGLTIVSVTSASDPNIKAEIEVNVFEVYAATINFQLDEISLDNVNEPTKQLSWTYTTTKDLYDKPTKENVSFEVTGDSVSVSNTGLLTALKKGDSVVKISILNKDKEEISDTINVHVTYHSTTVSFKENATEMYNDETLTLTAITTPSLEEISDDTVEFEVTSNPLGIANYQINDNKITLIPNPDAEGEIIIRASNDGRHALRIIKVSYRPVYFQADTNYIVGNRDYSSGTSVDNGKTSWGEARLAKMVTERTSRQEEDLIREDYVRMTFKTGDLWKVYNGSLSWLDPIDDDTGYNHYHKDTDYDDVFSKGMMVLEGRNVKVTEDGTYDIYIKMYVSKYELYIAPKPSLSVSNAPSSLQIDTVAEFSAHNIEGELNVITSDAEVIKIVNYDQLGTITIKGLKLGSATVTVSDDVNEIDILISVTNSPSSKSIYVNANGKFDEAGAKMFAHAWLSSDSENNKLTVELSKVSGQDIIYKVDMPLNYDSVLFLRNAPSVEAATWDGDDFWGQTPNYTLADHDLWTMTGYEENSKTMVGTWSTYDPNHHYEVPVVQMRTIYLCDIDNVFFADGAKGFVHAWGSSDFDAVLTKVLGQNYVYSVEIPADEENVVFVRNSPDATSINWNGDLYWGQTIDLGLLEDKDMFKVSNWSDNKLQGDWAVFDEDTTYGPVNPTPDPDPDPTPTPENRTIYLCDPDNLFFADSAKGYIHAWGGSEDCDALLTKVEGQNCVYSVEIPSDEQNVVFVRQNPDAETLIWDDPTYNWGQTIDLLLQEDKDMFTISNWENDKLQGSWSIFDEETIYGPTTPVDPTPDPDPIPTPVEDKITLTFYLNDNFKANGCWAVLYVFEKDNASNHKVVMAKSSNWDTGEYVFEFEDNYDSFILVRMNAGAEVTDGQTSFPAGANSQTDDMSVDDKYVYNTDYTDKVYVWHPEP